MGFETVARILVFIHNAFNVIYWLFVAGTMFWIVHFWKKTGFKMAPNHDSAAGWRSLDELEDRKIAKRYQAADVHF